MRPSLVLLAMAPVGAAAFVPNTFRQSTVVSEPLTAPKMSSVGFDNEKKGIKFPSFGNMIEWRADEVVIDPDYKLAWFFAFVGVAIGLFYGDKTCYENSILCPPTFVGGLGAFIHIWFASFLADRTTRVRCVFDKNSFRMMDTYDNKKGNVADKMVQREGNYVVGGTNRWTYDSIFEYKFIPSVDLPILVYFKENATPKEKWVIGPGRLLNKGNGMVHFFPAFANAYQLREEFEKRNCNKGLKK